MFNLKTFIVQKDKFIDPLLRVQVAESYDPFAGIITSFLQILGINFIRNIEDF